MAEFHVVIPARYASSRLPGKPLLALAGRPLIQHVYDRGQESGADSVIIATDDARIREAAEGFGARVVMTREDHASGTDRLAECVEILGLAPDAIVVNLQGDEPLTPTGALRQVVLGLDQHPEADMSTLCARIRDGVTLHDPNAVKVLRDADGMARYFSRAPIPWHREQFGRSPGSLPERPDYFRHIGIYGYRVRFLNRFSQLSPSPSEQAESLEQLRALHHGVDIFVDEYAGEFPAGVDTPADLERVERLLDPGFNQ